MADPIKPCIKCGESDRNKQGQCKPCNNERKRKRYKDNPDKIKQAVHKYYEANPEKVAERQRKYREANRERLAERKREYNEENREKVAEYNRKWQRDNPEKVAKKSGKWNEANREKVADIRRKWAESNPERIRAIRHSRRAKVKGNGGKLSPNIVQTLMILQKGRCACCKKSLEEGYHLDHIMPIALGGSNSDENVQLLTPKCNLSKGTKHPIDYMRGKGLLI